MAAYSSTTSIDAAPPEAFEVLILDDNSFERKRLRRILDNLPVILNCTETSTMQAFRHQIRQKTYDMVVIDYALADGDGLEAMVDCRASDRNQDALFVLVTGYDNATLAGSALGHGFDDYLKKDEVDPDQLAYLLRSAHSKRMDARGPQALAFAERYQEPDFRLNNNSAPSQDGILDPDTYDWLNSIDETFDELYAAADYASDLPDEVPADRAIWAANQTSKSAC